MPPVDVSEMILTAEPWHGAQDPAWLGHAFLVAIIVLLVWAIYRQELQTRRRRRA